MVPPHRSFNVAVEAFALRVSESRCHLRLGLKIPGFRQKRAQTAKKQPHNRATTRRCGVDGSPAWRQTPIFNASNIGRSVPFAPSSPASSGPKLPSCWSGEARRVSPQSAAKIPQPHPLPFNRPRDPGGGDPQIFLPFKSAQFFSHFLGSKFSITARERLRGSYMRRPYAPARTACLLGARGPKSPAARALIQRAPP